MESEEACGSGSGSAAAASSSSAAAGRLRCAAAADASACQSACRLVLLSGLRLSMKRKLDEMVEDSLGAAPGASSLRGSMAGAFGAPQSGRGAGGLGAAAAWDLHPRPVKRLCIDKRSPWRRAEPMVRSFAQVLTRAGRLTEDRAAVLVQRWWRVAERWRCANQLDDKASAGVIRSFGRNVICPMTQDVIPVGKCFRVFTSNGTALGYSAMDLMEYLVSSGRFQCPCTREYFMRPEIARLQRLCARIDPNDLKVAQLLHTFDNRHAIRYRELEHENRCLAVENSCGGVMTDALDLCGDLTQTTAEVNLVLQGEILPDWGQMVNDYARLDRDKCRTMLLADREKLRRLGGQAMADAHGLMWLVSEAVERKLLLLDGDASDQFRLPPVRFQFTMPPLSIFANAPAPAPTPVPLGMPRASSGQAGGQAGGQRQASTWPSPPPGLFSPFGLGVGFGGLGTPAGSSASLSSIFTTENTDGERPRTPRRPVAENENGSGQASGASLRDLSASGASLGGLSASGASLRDPSASGASAEEASEGPARSGEVPAFGAASSSAPMGDGGGSSGDGGAAARRALSGEAASAADVSHEWMGLSMLDEIVLAEVFRSSLS